MRALPIGREKETALLSRPAGAFAGANAPYKETRRLCSRTVLSELAPVRTTVGRS